MWPREETTKPTLQISGYNVEFITFEGGKKTTKTGQPGVLR